jgi:hypothetical protein
LTAAAVPQALASLDHDRAVVAAHYLASRMYLARTQAATRSATVALRFDEGQTGTTVASFIDGNRNGIRTREIQAGVDRPLDPAMPLAVMYPGVRIGLAADAIGSAIVRPGASTLLSFAPAGTASSGSVYVTGRDSSRYAVRVLGATGRVRVQRYDALAKQWVSE